MRDIARVSVCLLATCYIFGDRTPFESFAHIGIGLFVGFVAVELIVIIFAALAAVSDGSAAVRCRFSSCPVSAVRSVCRRSARQEGLFASSCCPGVMVNSVLLLSSAGIAYFSIIFRNSIYEV